MRLLLPLLLLSACAGKRLDPPTPLAIARAPVTVDLGPDLQTTGELTFPERRRGPFPTVILVGGAGPQDMDATLDGPAGTTRLFADLATALSSRGFAVLRVHKRHVRGPQDFDLPAFFTDQSTATFREDLDATLTAARALPQVDPQRVFLYGWDEGSVVATAVAADHPELAGLALQGAVGMPWRQLVRGWWTELTVPYLQRFATVDLLSGRDLARALNSAACEPARNNAAMLAVSWTRRAPVVRPSPLVDTNRDGLIDIGEEVEPRIDELVDLAFSPLGNFQSYTGERSLPTVDAQIGAVRAPVLLLQGAQDAHTPPPNADRIEAALAGHADATVLRLPGLGHTLGHAADPVDDLGRPMEADAIQALVDWLVARARR